MVNKSEAVRLIAASQPEPWLEKDIDGFVAYVARVSNPSNQNNDETSQRLLQYLIKNKHWSPLEMVSATVEINTTRDIARQILRHRSFSFQEFSQRYSSEIEFAEPRPARLQDHKNRQNSIEDGVSENTSAEWECLQNEVVRTANRAYKNALDMGIAKEVARSVLPEGLTKSRLYMAGTLRSWVHYIDLRTGNGTQKEHMEIAAAIRDCLTPKFPTVFAALGGDNG